jgi:hypothetical protein
VGFSRLTDPVTVRPFLLDARRGLVVPDHAVPADALWWSRSPTGDYLLTLRLVNEVQVEATFHDMTTDRGHVALLPDVVVDRIGGAGIVNGGFWPFYHDWHPSAPLVAYMPAHTVWAISPDGVSAVGALEPEPFIQGVRWSPDGTQLAILRPPSLFVLDVGTDDPPRPVTWTAPGETEAGYTTDLYGWDGEGETLWVYEQYISGRECVVGVRSSGGDVQQRYCQRFLQPWSLRFATYDPLTDAFAFERINENTFRNRLSLLTDDARPPDVFHIDSFWHPFAFDFAPADGRLLVTSAEHWGAETLYLLDMATGDVRQVGSGFDGRWTALPGGR